MRAVCHFIIIREKYFKDYSDETDDELDDDSDTDNIGEDEELK